MTLVPSCLLSALNFYAALKIHAVPLTVLLVDANFTDLPDDWHVVVADIQNSSAAVRAGAHSDVNLVAAGSLVAGLNIARSAGLDVPFFFGGDGGTLLVPDSILPNVLEALDTHNRNSQKNFGLTMHVGAVSMMAIRRAGHTIRLAKMRIGRKFSKAVLVGSGLLWAERQVKAHQRVAADPSGAPELNMAGLECRWDRIKPPHAQPQIVCYLIEACNPSRQVDLYRDVLLEADRVFGTQELRNPLSIDKLDLLVTVRKLRKEVLARFGRLRRSYLVTEFFKTALGKLIFRYNLKLAGLKGKNYLEEVISNADTLTLDGRINTIISGTDEQRLRFLSFLDGLESAGHLRYGHHTNGDSVMTCYIESRQDKHVHFVDGGDGGYTSAAVELKGKTCRT